MFILLDLRRACNLPFAPLRTDLAGRIRVHHRFLRTLPITSVYFRRVAGGELSAALMNASLLFIPATFAGFAFAVWDATHSSDERTVERWRLRHMLPGARMRAALPLYALLYAAASCATLPALPPFTPLLLPYLPLLPLSPPLLRLTAAACSRCLPRAALLLAPPRSLTARICLFVPSPSPAAALPPT
jgi:hypothetical protein